MTDTETIVVGAGPYGLSAGAFLRRLGVDTHVVGDVMSFWRDDMPRGLKLRSPLGASEIGSQIGDLTLSEFASQTGSALVNPLPIETFVDYGSWFQRRAVSDVDTRRVTRIERRPKGFLVGFDDGGTMTSARVVVAAGIHPFARIPPEFAGLPSALASHSAEHSSFDRFAGATVLVVGGGQSALESAALLHEVGAAVEVLVRRPAVRFLVGGRLRPYLGRLSFLAYPPEDVGPPGLNLVTVRPNVLKRFPRSLQAKIARRSIRPAGASWLVSRIAPVTVTTGVTAVEAASRDEQLELRLSDGTSRSADHVILATGFRVDVARYGFIGPDLAARLALIDGYPILNSGFESSVPGLHFLGAPAAQSFGPLMRFVSGTWFATHGLTKAIAGRTIAPARAPRHALPSSRTATTAAL